MSPDLAVHHYSSITIEALSLVFNEFRAKGKIRLSADLTDLQFLRDLK